MLNKIMMLSVITFLIINPFKTNINHSTTKNLYKIKGVGIVKVKSIIRNKPYKNLNDFRTKNSKVGEKVIQELAKNYSFQEERWKARL